jgi:hypothetical protein
LTKFSRHFLEFSFPYYSCSANWAVCTLLGSNPDGLVLDTTSLAFLPIFIESSGGYVFGLYRLVLGWVTFFGYLWVFNNAAHDPVKYLRRVKQMGSDFSMEISITALASSEKNTGYIIKAGQKTMEEVVLPFGVGLQGSVLFREAGTLERPGNFDMCMGNHEVSVDVDMLGVVKTECSELVLLMP